MLDASNSKFLEFEFQLCAPGDLLVFATNNVLIFNEISKLEPFRQNQY